MKIRKNKKGEMERIIRIVLWIVFVIILSLGIYYLFKILKQY